jgi:hypothetical protein
MDAAGGCDDGRGARIVNTYQRYIDDQRPRIYDWELDARELDAQHRETYERSGIDYHTGLSEGRSETADLLQSLPPEMPAEEKVRVLFRFLESTLMGTQTADDDGDED